MQVHVLDVKANNSAIVSLKIISLELLLEAKQVLECMAFKIDTSTSECAFG
jgi:hypothetical protein